MSITFQSNKLVTLQSNLLIKLTMACQTLLQVIKRASKKFILKLFLPHSSGVKRWTEEKVQLILL